MELLIIIGILALVVLGYFQAKKQDTVLLSDSFTNPEAKPFLIKDTYFGMDIGNGLDHSATVIYSNGTYMSPKQYGEQYGNGKSRIKKSNRLHFRK